MHNFFNKKPQDLTNPNRAVECYKQGNYQEALLRADAIIQANPQIAVSHRFKGEVLLEMARYQEAIASFLKAEKIGGPGTEELCCFRALAYTNLGDTHSALSILNARLQSGNCSPDLTAKIEKAIATINNLSA